MTRRAKLCLGLVSSLASLALLAPPAAPQVLFTANYEASTGGLPTSACPPWDAFDTASPEDPTVAAGVLTLSTSALAENMYFTQSGPNFAILDTLVIEFRTKLISGSSNNAARAPIAVITTVTNSVGAQFFIGGGEIFLTSGPLTKGPSALVATTDDFHTYRLEIASGTVRVFYDGVFQFSGATWASVGDFGTVPRILFGEGSANAFGQSEWLYFRHTAGAIPCSNPPLPIVYDASTGLLPHQICPPWVLLDDSSNPPYLSGGFLVFETSAGTSRSLYWQPDVAIPETLVVEFRVKLDFGSSSNAARGPVWVAITTAPDVGILFFLDNDEMFFAAGHNEDGQLVRGQAAPVATTDDFHTYRIEIASNGVVSAYRDGFRKIVDVTNHDASDHGPTRRIGFGEGSVAAQGRSQWAFIRHNAGEAEGPPTTFSLGSPGDGDTVSTWRVPVDWTNSSDPDCNTGLLYYVEVDSTNTFATPTRFGPRSTSRDTVVVRFVPGRSYYWRVKAKDVGGDSTWASPGYWRFVTYAGGYPTGVESGSPTVPTMAVRLLSSNPIHGAVRFEYELPRRARVRTSVIDVHGRVVRRIEQGDRPPGSHVAEWDGRTHSGSVAATGAYVIVVESGRERASMKCILLR